ncbi:IS66 family insertion sequence element accessory protein TnpA [Clostridium ljungdahlii]
MNKWIKTIRECMDSGENVSSWCRNNGIKTNSYYYWLRKIRAAACKALPSINNQEQIVPMDMSKISNVISTDTAYVSSETSQADVIVHLGSAVLEFHNSASESLIQNIIKVLKNVG